MRARLAAEGLWPFLSELHGLHPWDVGRLTPAELDDYVTHVRAVIEARRR